MARKIHLARQDEEFEEYGFMIVENDPVDKKEYMTWFNMTEQRFKIHLGGVTRIISTSLYTTETQLPISNILDASTHNNFFAERNNDFTLQLLNLYQGLEVKLLVKNVNPNSKKVTEISLPSALDMNDGNYFKISAHNNERVYHVWYDFDGEGGNVPISHGSTGVRVEVTQGKKEKTEVELIDSLWITSGDFITLNSAGDANQYYLWLNKDNLGGEPSTIYPFLQSKIPIQVVISGSNTAEQNAELIRDALNNIPDFNATSSGDVVTIENNDIGSCTKVEEGSLGVTINQIVVGKEATSKEGVALLTATALDNLAEFNCPIPATETITVNNEDFGQSDNPENIDIPQGFFFNVVAQGGGPVIMQLPSNAKTDYIENKAIIPAGVQRLFSIVYLLDTYYVMATDFSL